MTRWLGRVDILTTEERLTIYIILILNGIMRALEVFP